MLVMTHVSKPYQYATAALTLHMREYLISKILLSCSDKNIKIRNLTIWHSWLKRKRDTQLRTGSNPRRGNYFN
jgi:hypothetical protein